MEDELFKLLLIHDWNKYFLVEHRLLFLFSTVLLRTYVRIIDIPSRRYFSGETFLKVLSKYLVDLPVAHFDIESVMIVLHGFTFLLTVLRDISMQM